MATSIADLVKQVDEQLSQQNQARAVKTRISNAIQALRLSKRRWTWELFQNTVDSGVEYDRPINVYVALKENELIWAHDGGPFRPKDISAIIHGGSSRPYQLHDDFTGQYGSGFLVAHVVSPKVQVNGLLAENDRWFTFDLDRSGEEQAIVDNIVSCYEQLKQDATMPAFPTLTNPRAIFRYSAVNPEVAGTGLDSLEDILPYVMAFRPKLHKITLDRQGEVTVWERGELKELPQQSDTGNRIEQLSIHKNSKEYRSVLLIHKAEAILPQCAVTVCRTSENGFEVMPPATDLPRLYCQYPLFSSDDYGFDFVINADFEVDERRSGLMLNEEKPKDINESKIDLALALVPALAEFVVEHKYAMSQRLAYVRPPILEDKAHEGWWRGKLINLASRLSDRPIVKCGSDTIQWKNGMCQGVLDTDGESLVSFHKHSPDMGTVFEALIPTWTGQWGGTGCPRLKRSG